MLPKARLSVLFCLCLTLTFGPVLAQDPGSQTGRRTERRPLPDWARNSWMFRRAIDTPIAFTNANVVDVETGELKTGVTIVVAGDVIRSVGTAAPPPGAAIRDLAGSFVIPGLVDLHAHVIPEHPAFPSALPPKETLERLLAHGVTTIRCLPLASETGHRWAAEINAGLRKGPTIVSASAIFEMEPQRTSFGFHDATTAVRWVTREALLGSHWIKVYNRMDRESLAAIVDTAHRYGMRVCGHAEDVLPHVASQLGIDCIEHITGIPRSCPSDDASGFDSGPLFDRVVSAWEQVDDERARLLMQQFVEDTTAWVPTLVVTEQIARSGLHDGQRAFAGDAEQLYRVIERAAELAVSLHRSGGLVGAGTDFPVDGVTAGDSVHRELELLVELGGATPIEALQIATVSSARILGMESLFGSIAENQLANLVILGANPLHDISNTQQIQQVMREGRTVWSQD